MIQILIKFEPDMDQVTHESVNNYRKIALYNLPLSIQILAINLFITMHRLYNFNCIQLFFN